MKRYGKKDCSICVEYPYGCDDCYSEMKTFMTTKNKLLLNKRQKESMYNNQNSQILY